MINEARRAPRRPVPDLVPVTDCVAEATIGRIGNLSETGMLLLGSAPLVDDALYQLSFPLPDSQGRNVRIDVGVHLLWSESTNAPGQSWAGCRFIAISEDHRELLRNWVAQGVPV